MVLKNTKKQRTEKTDTPLNVLVVDDDAFIRRLFSNAFDTRGHTCRTAIDGADAMEQLQNEDCDVVVLDLMMPTVTGGHFLSLKEQTPSTAKVLVVSSRESGGDMEMALSQGADYFLPKPETTPESVVKHAEMLVAL